MKHLEVFKFGGASVKDAEAVVNMANILKNHPNNSLFVVVSAMGKNTNALEQVTQAIYNREPKWRSLLEQLFRFHYTVISQLFENPKMIAQEVKAIEQSYFQKIETSRIEDYNQLYDTVVPIGELLATKIIAAYLNTQSIPCLWKDARELITTDSHFRSAEVDWNITTQNVTAFLEQWNREMIITQGFVGSTLTKETTTLGREGSDFTAAILAYAANAKRVTVWKDVPGLLNADPKKYPEAVKLEHLSYREAVELAFFGAKVIHPKTIKPLENRSIPLHIRSFINETSCGTTIDNHHQKSEVVESFIIKENQLLLSLATRDFSFICEKQIAKIFGVLSRFSCKANLMQNSAVSFSICIDNDPYKIPKIIEALKNSFTLRYNSDLELITVRHTTGEIPKNILKGRKILLEQRNRTTLQLVVENTK